ncbi:ExbD/TolR family protein [Pseudaquidulcibacter saccharophilus]|uniref:ExbD/TolR family protein n=1 Tax=Pseudaquidulcibacter saccharophilus TaxID=2831900 RepID=UPI001EFF0100|nr:biopolymer transporter ExbD [Pseudaquidulcibacter saccharophilus]
MAIAAGRRKARRGRRLMGEINVTPFVDVTLVLLIIFMVAAPLLTVGVPVDLPKTDAKSLPNEQEPVSITILNNGQIYLQQDPVSQQEVLARLNAITKNDFERRIFIRGDSTSQYGIVMQVMANINAAGYRNLGLVTDPTTKTDGTK